MGNGPSAVNQNRDQKWFFLPKGTEYIAPTVEKKHPAVKALIAADNKSEKDKT